MNSRLVHLMLLVIASLATTVAGQGFLPAPGDDVSRGAFGGANFPLPENSILQTTQPFRSESEPDWKVVRLMAELSFLAYEDSFPTVQNRLRLFDLSLASFATVDNHHVISGWDQGSRVLVIAFRGTDISQLADVWTDLDYETEASPVGNVHRGFYLATNALLGGIHYEIRRRKPRHIWITGHSLGGAMATICLAELDRLQVPVTGVVTFGQPRVGDKAFTENLNQGLGSKILRVINEQDIVASLPPYIPFKVPRYYSGGSVMQFSNGLLVRSGGVQMMAKPVVNGRGEVIQVFGEQKTGDSEAPRGPSGEMPPDPEQLTEDEYRELQDILHDDGSQGEQQYGGPLGSPFDRFNLKERASQHPMHLYIQNIERFAAEGK
ncbi:lipase family protein [Allorhodopirellula solitaria]|uniref:Lipase (Class 3) n=1 Tax=Allorhodopirellula solitaria TaxID=2527987 RepID=A0A5C5X2P3_9BACT|nr:lipase family protein [Allorhodopirellula solitaria]TWT56445.1 Lipase (class 3) [Allorhodopirellula solitaria]